VPPAPPRDRRLAERLAEGDESALRDVYREYAAAVYGLARRVLANAAHAEDVTQDVFVRLWERPERYDPERGTLRSFVLAMTHSRAVERVRAEEARHRRQEQDARISERDDTAPDPAAVHEERAAATIVRDALTELPEPERVPIELAYYRGMSYRRVAEHLGEPVGTVKHRIRRGMHRMRAALRAAEVT
jgi:RNA polymerase sigma-70 factor (ECF subfamily)